MKSNFHITSILLVFLTFLCSCKGQETTKPITEASTFTIKKVLADSISQLADTLPEFKNDLNAKESQGNQISGVIRTMFQDSQKNYWFGTQNGLSRYDGYDLVYYDLKASNGQGIVVHVILEDKNGHIWIGYGGGIAKYDGTYFTNYYEKNILVNSGLWSMAMDRNGLLWIGTIYGVYTFDGNAFQPFEIPEGKVDTGKGISASKMIHCIIEDSKGHMWFATNGGAYRYDGNILTIFSEKEGLNSYFVNSIIEDKNGQYWFSTADNGLFRFDGTSFTNILKNTEIEGKGVGDIIEDRNGNIWFELKNFGVYSYDGKTLTNYPKEEGMSFEIYEDLLGRLWFVGFKGAYRMDGNSFVNVNRNGPW